MTKEASKEIKSKTNDSILIHKARNANDYDAMLFDFLEKEFKKETN